MKANTDFTEVEKLLDALPLKFEHTEAGSTTISLSGRLKTRKHLGYSLERMKGYVTDYEVTNLQTNYKFLGKVTLTDLLADPETIETLLTSFEYKKANSNAGRKPKSEKYGKRNLRLEFRHTIETAQMIDFMIGKDENQSKADVIITAVEMYFKNAAQA